MQENQVNNIPNFLLEKLNYQYGEKITNNIIEGYNSKRYLTIRVNTLKTTVEDVLKVLDINNIEYERVKWSDVALIIKNAVENDIKKLEIYKNGYIYMQSLSSMLPPIVLNPKEKKDILDMTAAPGGKTTEIAALTSNKAFITACELNNIRAERLKYNIEKQGAKVNVMLTDARNLDSFFSFDQILLDAPCSGSGTINLNDINTYKGFTEKLIMKSIKAQKALLKKAIEILKVGQEMVYSTCSILSEENEDVIINALNKNDISIVPIDFKGKETLPLLPCKIKEAICVMPNKYYEGFFVVKIRKNK